MRRVILSLALPALLIAGASRASASGLDGHIGGFFPRGHETLFSDLNSLYTPNADPAHGVQPSDFNGVYGGIEYNTVVAPMIEVGVGFDAYGRSVDTSYRDYTRPDNSEIQQRLKLNIYPLGVTVRVLPTSKHTRIVPYVGGGIDAVFYNYEEFGDFIDFNAPGLDIVSDHFKDNGAAFGVHAVAGLRVYLNRDFAIVGEGRYLWAEKDMGHDFANTDPTLPRNRIDLSGASFVVGLHVRF